MRVFILKISFEFLVDLFSRTCSLKSIQYKIQKIMIHLSYLESSQGKGGDAQKGQSIKIHRNKKEVSSIKKFLQTA